MNKNYVVVVFLIYNRSCQSSDVVLLHNMQNNNLPYYIYPKNLEYLNSLYKYYTAKVLEQ